MSHLSSLRHLRGSSTVRESPREREREREGGREGGRERERGTILHNGVMKIRNPER